MIIAHRGLHTKYPENTVESIGAAVDVGIKMVELDVRRSRDGKIYLFHDRSLKRLTGYNRFFINTHSRQIDTLLVQNEFKIPKLEEVFSRYSGRVQFLLDIKKETMLPDNLERNMMDLIEKYNLRKDCIVSSFNYFVIKRISTMGFSATGMILAHPLQLKFLNHTYFNSIHVNLGHLFHPFIQQWIKTGKMIYVWNVKSEEEVTRVQKLYPAAGIISDLVPQIQAEGNKTDH